MIEEVSMEPLYKGGGIKVYPDRIEYKVGFKNRTILTNQITGVYTTAYGNLKIVTTGNKKFKINVGLHSKGKIRDAIIKAQTQATHPQVSTQQPTSTADELTKLADLKEKGVITKDEFESQKAQLLGDTK